MNRAVPTQLWCTNEHCINANEYSPINGIAWLGSQIEPPSVGPDRCPLCDAPTDTIPLIGDADEFEADYFVERDRDALRERWPEARAQEAKA